MKNYITLTLNKEAKKEAIREALKNGHGKFFSVTFIKKDGSQRMLTGRLGVKKGLVGGQNTVQHIDKYLTVWDAQKKQWRNVNLETVQELNAFGQRLKFKEA